MLGSNVQKPEAAVPDLFGEIGRLEFTECLLDRDLPDGCRADVDIAFPVQAVLDVQWRPAEWCTEGSSMR
jgi:hypothetical protein